MKVGTKFRAIRRSNGEPLLSGITRPHGLTLKCTDYEPVDERGGLITCKEKTPAGKFIQVFERFYDLRIMEKDNECN